MTNANSGAAAPLTNPFPGLRPFETDEYRLFFGREGQADALVERLERSRFLAVVGTSGSGKSSLVRAGLLPALRGGMMAGAGAGWRVAVMRPGHDPVGNLARALAEDGVLAEAGAGLRPDEREAVVEATLRGGSLGLVETAARARLGHKLLVVVDQFEELFRFRAARAAAGAIDDDASAFVKLLLEAARQRELPVYVVLTMRSDFLGDCAQFQGLPEAINDGQYLIPRMTRDERRFAIAGPARVARGRMSEPLVNRLLNDVGDNPDQLPILQHALMRTWDYWSERRRDGEPVGLEHYEAVGTMSDALSLHADEAWDELPDERSRQVAEALFKSLTERGADNREIRRPTRLGEICEVAGATPAEVAGIVEVFRREGRSFLMPPAGVALTPETVVDISHESLIRNWARLRGWVRDEAEAARIYRRLADAAVAQREGEGGLLDDVTLAWVDRWRERYHPNRAWGLRYHPEYDAAMAYLEESRAASEKRADDERARNERELEQARAFAEGQRRAASRMRRLLVVLAAVSVLALGAAGGAAYAYTLARSNQRKAEVSEREARTLLGDLNASRAQVLKAREEVALAENAVARKSLAVEEAEALAAAKEEKALAEQAKADEAKKAAEAAEREAEALRAKAARETQRAADALTNLRRETENDHRNRDALATFQRGNMAEAETKLAALSAAYEGDPLRQAWANAYLGAARRQLGKLPESIAVLRAAVETQRRAISEGKLKREDFEYLDTLAWLAHAHSDTGDYELAEPLYAEALAIRRRAARHADIAVSIEHLARNRNNLYRAQDAAQLYQEALEIRRQTPNSPDLVAALNEVAEFYAEDVGDKRAAVALYKEVVAVQERLLDPDDPNLAETYTELARLYEDMPYDDEIGASPYVNYKEAARRAGELAKAIRVGRRLSSREWSKENLEHLQALAWRYLALSKRAQAKAVMARSPDFATVRKVLTDKADAINYFMPQASLYEQLGEFEKAEGSYRALDELRGAGSGRGLTDLAAFYARRGRHAEAEPLYRRALAAAHAREGESMGAALNVAAITESLGASLLGQGKTNEAERLLQEAARRAEELAAKMNAPRPHASLGDALGLTIVARGRLAALHDGQGREKEAAELYEGLLKPLAGMPDEARARRQALSYRGAFDALARGGAFLAARKDDEAARRLFEAASNAWQSSRETAPEDFSLEDLLKFYEAFEALDRRRGDKVSADGLAEIRKSLTDPLP